MKTFYILIVCIAFFTLLSELKAGQEIICEKSTSSSPVARTHFFEFAQLHPKAPDHNMGITTITYKNIFITVTADLSEGSTA